MILSISSQKGGTGKTTTAAALATWATMHGMSALAVDLDAQGSLTYILKGDGNGAGSYELMRGTPAREIIQHRAGLPDLIPASLQLAGADAEYSAKPGRDFLLRRALEALTDRYSLIVIDTPPTLGTLLVNALTAADAVLITAQADTFALQSIYQLADTVQQVKQYCNPALKIAGVVVTRYSGRTVLARDMVDALAERCAAQGIHLYSTKIREGVAVKEAQTMQQPLFTYAPKSRPAQDYNTLIKEIMEVH